MDPRKGKPETNEIEVVESEPQKEKPKRSYYYDDAYGYEEYEPESEESDEDDD